MENKKTLVLGASLKPHRVSHQAIQRLVNAGHEVVAIGLREGIVAGVSVQKDRPLLTAVDTLSLYLNARNQEAFYDYIEEVNPKRIIFNPGAENIYLYQWAKSKGIEVENACSLVMLALDQY